MDKIFFLIYKNVDWILAEKQRKALGKGSWNVKKKKKAIKSSWKDTRREEKERKHQYYCKGCWNLSEVKRQSIAEYRINHYITHKKLLKTKNSNI